MNACIIDPFNFTLVESEALNVKDFGVKEDTNFNLDILDDRIKEAIAKAAAQTRDTIGKHQWMGKDTITRNSRIGYFTTNLRRELSWFVTQVPEEIKDGYKTYLTLRGFLNKFYNVLMWRDIASPMPNDAWDYCCYHNDKTWKMDSNRMIELCNSALTLSPNQEVSQNIEDSLASLQREMYSLKSGVEKMDQINRESDKIISNLCTIVENR